MSSSTGRATARSGSRRPGAEVADAADEALPGQSGPLILAERAVALAVAHWSAFTRRPGVPTLIHATRATCAMACRSQDQPLRALPEALTELPACFCHRHCLKAMCPC